MNKKSPSLLDIQSGDARVERWTRDGMLDAAFGTAGVVEVEDARGIRLDSGRLYVFGGEGPGFEQRAFIEARNPATGALDVSFADNGRWVAAAIGYADYVTAMAFDGNTIYAALTATMSRDSIIGRAYLLKMQR